MRVVVEDITPVISKYIDKALAKTTGTRLLEDNEKTTIYAENGIFLVNSDDNSLLRRSVFEDEENVDELVVEIGEDVFIVDKSFVRDKPFIGHISNDFVIVKSCFSKYQLDGFVTKLCLERQKGSLVDLWFEADGSRPITGVAGDMEKMWTLLGLRRQ